MIPTYASMEPRFAKLLDEMKVDNAIELMIVHRAREIVQHTAEYIPVNAQDGVPIPVIMALNERESGGDFTTYLGNGDPLDRPTRDVPAHRGPFDTWYEGAIDALHLDGLDKFEGQWTMELACYLTIRFNGWGYTARGINSPYAFAGSNLYTRGKFTTDHGFDPSAVDHQIGTIPLIDALVSIRPDWAIPRAAVAPATTEPDLATATEVEVLQTMLNKYFGGQLVVDGNYGRKTRFAVQSFEMMKDIKPADGIANADTIHTIIKDIALDQNAWKVPNIAMAQALLNEWGAHPPLVVDGANGPLTNAALCGFQDTNSLNLSGIVDDDTIEAMQDKIRRGV